MPLHPFFAEWLEAHKRPIALSEIGVEPLRAAMEDLTTHGIISPPVAKVESRSINVSSHDTPRVPIPVRIYTPYGTGPFPALVYFHGGGFVSGSINTHDNLCCALANAAKTLVVSVEYRLAPEHRFPAGLEDAYAATEWVRDHAGEIGADSGKLAVGGDSAGGNLAAVVSLLAKERTGPKIAHQLLIYPWVDLTPAASTAYPSYKENAEGYGVEPRDGKWFSEQYLASEADANNYLVSPVLAPNLEGLPPATIVTAQYDFLRDEGAAYAEKLRKAGVPVTLKSYDGAIHGFFSYGNDQVDLWVEAIKFSADVLGRAFSV